MTLSSKDGFQYIEILMWLITRYCTAYQAALKHSLQIVISRLWRQLTRSVLGAEYCSARIAVGRLGWLQDFKICSKN